MKPTKLQYFLWKSTCSNNIVMYAPSNITSEGITYYEKIDQSSSFRMYTWKSLTDLEATLRRSNYHFICSLLIPSDHIKEDLAKYYTTIKKNLSL